MTDYTVTQQEMAEADAARIPCMLRLLPLSDLDEKIMALRYMTKAKSGR